MYHFLILDSTVAGCISILAFASLPSIPLWIMSSAIGLKSFAITAGIKKYEAMIKKKKTKSDKIVFLAKSKWNSIEVLISKALIDSNISHDEFVLKNVLKERYKRSTQKSKDLNSSSKILVYLQNNAISLLEV